MADQATLSAALEEALSELDSNEAALRHENSDVTDVMNWMADVRKRARHAANADPHKFNAR